MIIPSFTQLESDYTVWCVPFEHDFIIINSAGRLLDTATNPRYIMSRTVSDQIAQEIDKEILEILLNYSNNDI